MTHSHANGDRPDTTGACCGQGNIGWLATDRHALSHGRNVAVRWHSAAEESISISYRQLAAESNRFANVLDSLGVQPGTTVASLLPRIPLLFIAVIGILKHRNVFCPLFESFGPAPVCQRLARGEAALLITTESHYRAKVASCRQALPRLHHVLLTDRADHLEDDVLSLPRLLAEAKESWKIPATGPDDPALLHFTSGTTGMPKGALHVHAAAEDHMASAEFAFGLQPGDIFWCTADPGWVTGTVYTIIAPLLHGVTTLIDQDDFDGRRWLRLLAEEQVNVLYTSPSALRRLMRLDASLLTATPLPKLRSIHSVGEPLEPTAVLWAERVLGIPVHDTWWQSETGSIMICNRPGQPIRPGSMGRPRPGVSAAIVNARTGMEEAAGTTGMLALKKGWPSMFRDYLGDHARYQACFLGNWYLSGDLARVDRDGCYWFCGRADDMIKTAGHLVGPFEVEAVLNGHPAVAEAAVYGVPDPLLGECVRATVTLRPGIEPSQGLRQDLLGYARRQLGPAIAPRQIDFGGQLPRNQAGKIMRRVLRAAAIGDPAGDLSTLTTPVADRNSDDPASPAAGGKP